MKPNRKPNNPNFSAGPTTKFKGWSFSLLENALLGRSHRSTPAKARINEVTNKIKTLLGLPEGYHVGILPASDTGAVEAAMWCMLGARPVDVFSWETFGEVWAVDVAKQLKLEHQSIYSAEYGRLPDLSKANPKHDIIFTWNGTTSGVKVPNADWISDNHEGIVICDATSAVFAMDMPWEKLDVTTFSWQKALGGEAQHGIMILSPKAVERLNTYKPSWPIPKLFQLTKGGKFNQSIFEGEVINTVSMMCVEDALICLKWVESIGGLKGAIKKSVDNFKAVEKWINKTDWASWLCIEKDPACNSNTSICFVIDTPWYNDLSAEQKQSVIDDLCSLISKEGAGVDFKNHRSAPPSIRIWGGATVEVDDIEALLEWVEWAYETVKLNQAKAA